MSRTPRERTNDSARDRASDATEVYETEEIYTYSPINALKVPEDNEFDYRWIIESVNGEEMPQETQKRFGEKYERVMIDQLPPGFVVNEDKGDGIARTGGLMLARVPKGYNRARQRHFQRVSEERVKGVNALQGIAGRDAVEEDRGSRSLTGGDARAALQKLQT